MKPQGIALFCYIKKISVYYSNLIYNFLEVEKAICPITGEPAKYKDPKSGVPYANLEAYKRLQEILRHDYLWSSEKGTFLIKSYNNKKRNAIKAKKNSNRVTSRIKIVKTLE